jgi:DNA helicase-2/ATP-dependent DNA helicase PcrA
VRPKVQVSRPASLGSSRVMGHASIELPPIKLGALVTHPKFGEGMVTDYEGNGAHARVQVEFADAGSKWLVMAYANLTVI